jgi:hypothetical protein
MACFCASTERVERTWTCDRCKTTTMIEVFGPPEGWEYLVNDENERFDLCPDCSAGFGNWMTHPTYLNVHINKKELDEAMKQAVGCTCPKPMPFD